MTTTTTTAPAPVERTTRPRRRRPVTLHAFPMGATEAARAMGTEARANCGVWIRPAAPFTYTAGGSHRHVPTRPCGNCVRIAASRGDVLVNDA
ncbi:hypothetical protein [Kytococcus sedentarius]|uniref:hypothetical protein n=1 Tax=Kytococcus sedentarius TaxID=1276 RepID=UPI0035BC2853